MATLAQLRTARAAAGAAYAAAAAAYVAAWQELAAYDATLGNKNLGGDSTAKFNNLPEVMVHPDYYDRIAAAAATSPNVLPQAVAARAAVLIASWSGS